MHVIIWRFKAQAGKEAKFELAYGPGGAWEGLFRRGDGYIGTELLRSTGGTPEYATIDRWHSEDAFEVFRREHKAAYVALDAQFESLTSIESHVGTFTSEIAPVESG